MFPEEVSNRTEAIQHRIENAGITRKVGKNQVRAIRVILSGTHEDMKQIEAENQLGKWCDDNLDWLKNTFGAENLVSAVLHLDEQTPHIHATVVPVVTGERRKAKKEHPEVDAKKKYKKKPADAARLCADDVMARDKLKEYQNTYAEAMQKYGLQRGIEGSEARHVSTQQYYRDLHLQNETLKENIETLQEQKTEANQELSRIKSGIKTEKLKSSAVDVATSAIEGIGTVLGSSKVKKLQQEVEGLKSENGQLQTKIERLEQQAQSQEKEYVKIADTLRKELTKIYTLFPKVKELIRIEKSLRVMRFTEELIKDILKMKPVGFKGKLYSAEYERHFATEHSVAEIKPVPDEPNKLRLTIDGVSDVSWFRQKYRGFQEIFGVKLEQKQEVNRNKGLKM